MFFVSFLISFIFTAYLIPRILFISVKKQLLDKPDGRKVHMKSSSRLGGVAFLPSIVFAMGVTVSIFSLYDASLWDKVVTVKFILPVCSCILLYVVGVADDINGVHYKTKFVFQTIAALLIIISDSWINNLYGILGIWEIPAVIGMPLTVFFIVFITNAINLIDGIDGLASGISCIVLSIFGILFIYKGMITCAMFSFATLGTLVAFFYYNVFAMSKRRHNIFMGDTGSLIIGFIISVLAIRFCQHDGISSSPQSYPFVIAFSVLIVPCFDEARVIINRFKKGRHLFLPDTRHIHHRFLALGFLHRSALIAILFICCFFIVLNMLICTYININILIFIDILIWISMHVYITKKIMQKKVTSKDNIRYDIN